MSHSLKDVDIPVISENSPREELMTYIRILEARLEIDHVWEHDPDHKLEGERSDILKSLVRRENSQERRVETLKSGFDGIGCRDIGRAVSRERNYPTPEEIEAMAEDDQKPKEG
jgi:hypothetical protein